MSKLMSLTSRGELVASVRRNYRNCSATIRMAGLTTIILAGWV
jgi:hypothetical protein